MALILALTAEKRMHILIHRSDIIVFIYIFFTPFISTQDYSITG